MKLFAFVDLHGNMRLLREIVARVNKNKYDVVVMAGDLTVFEQNYKELMEELSKAACPILILHGNHETVDSTKQVAARYEHIHFIHKKTISVKGLRFAGYGGGGFAMVDEEFEQFASKLTDIDVLVTHAPPYNTTLDIMPHGHVGSKSIRDYITVGKPRLAISGHLHENAGHVDSKGATKMINPGPTGRVIVL